MGDAIESLGRPSHCRHPIRRAAEPRRFDHVGAVQEMRQPISWPISHGDLWSNIIHPLPSA